MPVYTVQNQQNTHIATQHFQYRNAGVLCRMILAKGWNYDLLAIRYNRHPDTIRRWVRMENPIFLDAINGLPLLTETRITCKDCLEFTRNYINPWLALPHPSTKSLKKQRHQYTHAKAQYEAFLKGLKP